MNEKILKEGYIIDYISGTKVKATPEEIEAVQIFSKIIVEDYFYPKDFVQTRPQFRVRSRPSDTRNEYPVDIAIFENSIKGEENVSIIIECKKKNRKDGIKQLQDYLKFSKAKLGVWFNGDEKICIQKVENNGVVNFVEITDIPKFNESIDDIGKNKPSDLIIPHNLKTVFKVIHNHLAANATQSTRSEVIAKNLINIIFCKIFDEKTTKKTEYLKFSTLVLEDGKIVEKRIHDLFKQAKDKYKDVFDEGDIIDLDSESIKYVVGQLQNYSLIKSQRDVIADAFETFIGYTLKGENGQFFTPRNVVKLMVEITNPQPDDKIIDPACGTGGFLLESLRHKWNILDKKSEEYDWNEDNLKEEKIACAAKSINGIEKDFFLAKVAKAYMSIMGDGKGGLFCEDSLEKPSNWEKANSYISLESFDFVLTNPPFGKDILVTGNDKLSQYRLGHEYKKGVQQSKIKTKENPQILFIERSIQLLKDGGFLGIILPETYFHAPSVKNIREYFKEHNICWLIDLPHNTFRPYCNAKCIILILQKNKPQQTKINMAVAEEMGHNHNGSEIFRWDKESNKPTKLIWDDIESIIEEINNPKKEKKYTFQVDSKVVLEKDIFVPRYYWESVLEEVKSKAKNQNLSLIPIKDLVKEKIIEVFDGHGSPPSEYKGTGEVPYIRVKDIVNWEVYNDPTSLIPEELANKMRGNKSIQASDLVYVKRGSYRIGSTGMISPSDLNVILTKEILVFRILQKQNKYNLTPDYLLYLMNHPLVNLQTKSKVFIETTLPNISNRWNEIYLPFFNDDELRVKKVNEIGEIISYKHNAIKGKQVIYIT
jgi:type I restriction enzyme M protein